MNPVEPIDRIKCLRCGSLDVKLETWILPRSSGSRDIDRTLAKYNLNQTQQYVCQECGNKVTCTS